MFILLKVMSIELPYRLDKYRIMRQLKMHVFLGHERFTPDIDRSPNTGRSLPCCDTSKVHTD